MTLSRPSDGCVGFCVVVGTRHLASKKDEPMCEKKDATNGRNIKYCEVVYIQFGLTQKTRCKKGKKKCDQDGSNERV